MMRDEKPQKGNPHRLTTNQHVFPFASISRFVRADGGVSVYLIKQNKRICVKPDNQIFYAKWAWDQRAEEGFMKDIEDKYQTFAEDVFTGKIKTVKKSCQSIITDMYALWNIRSHWRQQPLNNYRLDINDVAKHYSKDEQEKLEKNHITGIRPDLTISGRHLTGSQIQNNLLNVRKQMDNARWGILRTSKDQFIVPDNFSNAIILPLSPVICFYSQSDDNVIDRNAVSDINKLAIESSREYYFANDLSMCPR